MDHIEKVQAEANSQERFRARQKSRGGFRKGCLTAVIAIIIGFVAVCVIVTNNAPGHDDAQKLAIHQREVERLTRIEQEVLNAISKGDYANALVKANTIHYTIPEFLRTYGSINKWDERREEIIKSIYQVSGMGTPTPIPSSKVVYMEGASKNTRWPKGNIAKLIPIPASDNIAISWERESGFYLEVNDFTQEDF